MDTFAAVMTGKGTGAISTIQVFGTEAEEAIRKIFKPAGVKSAQLKPGEICLGTIDDGAETIDQVTIGCEGPNNFAINCHGNPLIVADIMKLLRGKRVKPVTAEQLKIKILTEQKKLNTISIEATITLPKAKTIEGTKIVAYQITSGLNATAKRWLRSNETKQLEQIKQQAQQILKNSETAGLIIFGCTICIAGPANTGKSTLLNRLTNTQKAIVTDIKGTTRDWVSGLCLIGPLYTELIDTAGLDHKLAEDIDRLSQQKALEKLKKADLVLLVLDNTRPAEQLQKHFIKAIADKKFLVVLNKTDLPAVCETSSLSLTPAETVYISAKNGTGIETLKNKIQEKLDVPDSNLLRPVCITTRQKEILKKLQKAKSVQQAQTLITELLEGR